MRKIRGQESNDLRVCNLNVFHISDKIDGNLKFTLIDSAVRSWLVTEASNPRLDGEERGRRARRGFTRQVCRGVL